MWAALGVWASKGVSGPLAHHHLVKHGAGMCVSVGCAMRPCPFCPESTEQAAGMRDWASENLRGRPWQAGL